MARCIYCGSTGPFDREHSPPHCLGTFKGVEPLRDRVCKRCNNRLGQLDLHFCRSGPQAFFRHLLGIGRRKSHKPYSPFQSGPDGGPAIEVLGPCPGQDFFILLDPQPKRRVGLTDMEPLRQIVVKDRKGEWHAIFVPDSVRTPQQLRGLISSKVEGTPEEVRCFFDRRTEGWLPELVNKCYSGQYSEEKIPQSTGPTRARVQLIVREKYFRAIAKIMFHYYLQHDTTVRGDEAEFSELREFIQRGGAIDKFIIQTRHRLILGAANGARFTKYGHILTAQRDGSRVIGWAEFMGGPDVAGTHRYYVRIGPAPGRVVWCGSWGTFFYYYDRKQDGFDGGTEVLQPTGGPLIPVSFVPAVSRLTVVQQARFLIVPR